MPAPRIFCFAFTVFCLGIFSWSGKSWALSINQVRFGAHPDKVRLVLDLSEASDFRVFALADPYRMVIDLPDFQWNAGNASTTASSGVKALRYGALQPGVSRIVFDMAQPIAVRNAFIIPAQKDQPNRLVVDFSQVSQAEFLAQKDRIQGTLTSGPGTLRVPQNYSGNSGKNNNGNYNGRTATADNQQLLPPTKPQPDSIVRKPLIIIDPGHGGVDPGAKGVNQTNEKNVTLALAKELKAQLEASGRYRVALTRSNDVFIKLSDRVNIARRQEADLFISLHANSIDRSNVSGVSVYTLSEKASDAQTAKLADQENRVDLIAGIDLSSEDKDVANILVDLTMRDTMNQSNFFANTLLGKLRANNVALLEVPHRSAGFAVLKAPDIPSVLVENGFMSNKKEAALLNTAAHRKKIANALSAAVDTYFEKVRKNQRI